MFGTKLRAIYLKSIHNVRDLGGVPVGDSRAVKRGFFYRGSALYNLLSSDRKILFDDLGISSIVDLRVGWEVKYKPDTIPVGIEYSHIPFFDKEIVGIDYMKPLPGTIAVGHDFACDSHDFYQSMVNPLTVAQMGKAVRAVFNAASSGKPVYFHCSGGKDRAGVLAMLILTILGASYESVLEDYVLTNVDRDAHIGGVYKRFLRLCNGDEEFAWRITDAHKALPENLESFIGEINNKYGTIDSFICNQLGIDAAKRAELQGMFTEVI